jgi:hypothetical protein
MRQSKLATRLEGSWRCTHQYFLSIADTPSQILDIAICLHDFWCEFNAKPEHD